MTAERYQIGVACRHDRLCASAVKTACSDDRTGEVRTQILDCDWLLTFMQRVVTLDARLDHMQVSDLVAVEDFGHMRKGSFRIAVRDAAPFTRWRNAYANAIGAPDRDQRFGRFAQKAHAVFDRAAICIRAMIRAVL